MLLEGKKALIMGVANNRSIAYGISSAFARRLTANIIFLPHTTTQTAAAARATKPKIPTEMFIGTHTSATETANNIGRLKNAPAPPPAGPTC